MISKFKLIIKNHTEEIILVFGLLGALFIGYCYGKLNDNNGEAFLIAILPSAFVDIFSIVITTILITNLIEARREHTDKSRMYQIIEIPYHHMVHKMIWEYKYLIAAEPNQIYKKTLLEDININDIKDYFYRRVNENFQSDIVFFEDSKANIVKNTIAKKGYLKKRRIDLMEEYRVEIFGDLENFLKNYNQVATSDYLSLLVEIREYLKIENPLRIIYYDDYHGRTLEPTKIDVESFIKENQVYLDKVSKLKKYFKELDKN